MLNLVEEGRVVPIVGPDLLTLPGGKALYVHFAEQLAATLGVEPGELPEGGEINHVACNYLSAGNQVEDIYPALKVVSAKTDALAVPEPLLQLAAIPAFRLFVSTTFDSFLSRAIEQERKQKPVVLSYSPADVEDLPVPLEKSTDTFVYHLLGKVSATPAYAVTQEDVVEYFHALGSEARQPQLLFDELNRHTLLIAGSRFGGWLTRFFMRMSKGQRLSIGGKSDYLADADASKDESFVLFLKHFSKATKIYRSGSTAEFIAELHRRWLERHPKDAAAAAAVEPPPAAMHEPGAVFLSYASQDRPAALAIKDALEDAGVDVFFDRERLEAGDNWENKLRRSIRDCSLFMPLISQQTTTRDRRFFRVEWNLALEEAQMASFAPDDAFLLPVVIDSTNIANDTIPDGFRRVQWTTLPDGKPTAQFISRIQSLYRRYHKAHAR